MKKMNPPMTPWSAWKPRPPAAGLKERIFAARPSAPEHGAGWNLLVPAMACILLSLLVLNANNSLAPAGLRHNLVTDLILSNQSYSACAAGGSQSPQNHVDSLTFDWTNRSGLRSPVGFTSSTNY